MKKAQWFSRHTPTPEQIADAARIGFQLVGIETGRVLGATSMETSADVQSTSGQLETELTSTGAVALFGVFPPPLRSYWCEIGYPTEIWEAWNVQRTVEGGRPTFTHKSWERTA
jgi:hypothetical protein